MNEELEMNLITLEDITPMLDEALALMEKYEYILLDKFVALDRAYAKKSVDPQTRRTQGRNALLSMRDVVKRLVATVITSQTELLLVESFGSYGITVGDGEEDEPDRRVENKLTEIINRRGADDKPRQERS